MYNTWPLDASLLSTITLSVRRIELLICIYENEERSIFNHIFQGKVLISTKNSDCISVPPGADLSEVMPCSHEEADTRMMLHVADAAREGHRNIMMRSSDSDVVNNAVRTYVKLGQLINQLWVALGAGRTLRYYYS